MLKRRRVSEAPVANDVLEINVSGRIFTTRFSTLCFEKDSMIAKLFAKESPFGVMPTDAHKRPFIERDSDVFALIMDYLRRGGRFVGVSGLSVDTLAKLRDDAEYFGLAGLVKAVDDAEAARRVALKKADKKRLAETIAAEQRRIEADALVKARRPVMKYNYFTLRFSDCDELVEDIKKIDKATAEGFRIAHKITAPSNEAFMFILERETTDEFDVTTGEIIERDEESD